MTSGNPLILGIGNDIIEIDRIRQSIAHHGPRLLSRLFTQREQDYCAKYADPIPHLAGRFSAKEAIAKALGTGFGKEASWLDFEILNDPTGKPSVFFSEKLQPKVANTSMLITISHCRLYVTATALWTRS